MGTTTQAAVTVNGTATTTSVSVTQAAAQAEADTVLASATATEVDTETFVALTVGQTLIVGGLTFTAGAAGTTAAQTAAAFANLSAGAFQGNSTLGTYSGALATWNTGAVTGTSTVTFTDATANTTQVPPAFTGTGTAPTAANVTTGLTQVIAAQAGVVGIVGGQVVIANGGSSAVATVALDGYGAASTIASTHLATLSLADSNATSGSDRCFWRTRSDRESSGARARPSLVRLSRVRGSMARVTDRMTSANVDGWRC